MAQKFTKAEDIYVEQSIRFTDGNYGTRPVVSFESTTNNNNIIILSINATNQGSGSDVLQVFRPRQGFDLLYQNPNMNSGSSKVVLNLDNRFYG